MASVIQYYNGINSVAVIGNYLPRQCGIATFTTALVNALSRETPDINYWAVVMNDKPEGYSYPEKVVAIFTWESGVPSSLLIPGKIPTAIPPASFAPLVTASATPPVPVVRTATLTFLPSAKPTL